MRSITSIAAGAAALSLVAGGAGAAVLTVKLDSGVQIRDTNAAPDTASTPAYDNVGDNAGGENWPATGYFPFGQSGWISNAGYVFVLPALPAGETVSSIVLSALLDGTGSPANADLYGQRIGGAPLGAADYAVGPVQSSGTLVKDNWYGPDSGKNGGDWISADLTAWVASTGYAAGANLQVRAAPDLSAEALHGTGRSWTFGNAGGEANRPYLTITTATAVVPEPAAPAVLAAATAATASLATRRRRRRPSA